MNKRLLYLLFGILLTTCHKNDLIENPSCYNLANFDNWETINFKTNYTIQVPINFIGPGMQGFEGNTFSKSSANNRIQLSYFYANSLSCFDFGDTLTSEIPNSILVINDLSQLITLNNIESFCKNGELMGYLYYSNNNFSRGRLFWKDGNVFKQALEINFYLSELNTVNNIIETIKRKE
jgi:hypothetical protein